MPSRQTAAAATPRARSGATRPVLATGLALALALSAVIISLCFGARALSLNELLRAVLHFDPARPADIILWEMRLTRSLNGLATGAALAVAGLVMQQLSRNPLADPGILGVNAGAALAVVLAIWLADWRDPQMLSLVAVPGAGLAALAVFALGGGGYAVDRSSILRLTLAGVAVSALCLAIVAAIVLLEQGTRDLYRFWTIGSLAVAEPGRLLRLLPLLALGFALPLLMARELDALALGAQSAQSFGVPVALTIGAGLASVACLAGASVALSGPMGFIGLIVPHLARRVAGPALLPGLLVSAPLGGAILLGCDTLGRVLARPAEIQTGVVLALIGGPMFLLMLSRIMR
jgi:iron complex transport system permease protein